MRRRRHFFATAPNPRILRALLAMATTPVAAAAAALDAANDLAAQELAGAGTAPNPNSTSDPSNARDAQLGAGDPAALERALEAANAVVDAMDFAREQLDAAAAAAAAASAQGSSRM